MSSPAEPAPTRRDGGAPPAPPQPAFSGPAPTRRDLPRPQVTPTRRDDSGGRHRRFDEVAEDDVWIPSGPSSGVHLPAELAARFRPVSALPQHGSEADVIRVQDATGEDLIIKLYRPEISPDPDVWRALPQLRTPNLVRVHETGQVGGRSYEVMEYLSGGNLRALTGKPFDPDTITDLVRQLAGALAVLHEANITHRDIKPENILLRSPDSNEYVLTDFGLSRHLEQSMIFSTAARTLIYTAPETFYDHVSLARDWWSLGVIVHELATGKRPFQGLSEHPIMMQLARHAFPVDDVEDPRIRLLCRGLLVHDFETRWGLKQVQEWLDGGSPAVPKNRGPADQPATDVRPFLFMGEHYTEPRVLALAMAQNWQTAARQHFARLGEHWNDLRNWLSQFDDPDRFDVAGRRDMVDELADPDSARADAKLLRLLSWLDPKLPPTYRGFAAGPKHLVGLALAAASGDARSSMVVEELWAEHLLPVLARFAGGEPLTDVDARWRHMLADFDRMSGQLMAQVPETEDRFSDPDALKWARAVLLAQAAAPANVTDALLGQIHQARASMPSPVPWFDRFLAEMGRAPQRVVIGALIGPLAVAQSQQTVRNREINRRQSGARRAQWQQRERKRLARLDSALGTALAGIGIVLVPYLGWLTALSWTSLAGTTLGVLGLLAIVVCTAGELGLAWRLGGSYSPEYALLWKLRLAARKVGALMQLEGSGKELYAAAAAVTALIIVTVLVPVVVPVALMIAQVYWVWRRHRAWAENYVREQREALGTP